MKYLILLLVLLPIAVAANDLSVVYTDDIAAGDTVAMRTDTVYTPWMDVRDFKRIWLSFNLEAYPYDTNFAGDTFFLYLQHSPDKRHLTTTAALQSVVKGANDTIINVAASINRDSLFFGNWNRFMVVHVDSLSAAADTLIVGNEYKTKITVWLNTVE